MANVKFIYTSKELTPRERLKLKDRADAIQLSEAVDRAENGYIDIYPDIYAELEITGLDELDDNGDEKIIKSFMIISKDGVKYTFTSEALWNSFINIGDEMGDEEFGIRCFKKQSKKNAAYRYLTCTII